MFVGQRTDQIAFSYLSFSFGQKVMHSSGRVRVTSAAVESSVLEASHARGGAAVISPNEDQADFCPHCRSPFEIVHVQFRFNGTAMIAACPNCATASVDERRGAESKILDHAKKLAINTRGFWHGVARMYSLDRRFRYVLAFLIGAVIAAAALRHIVHMYGGISREEIRAGALMAIPGVALAIIFLRRKHRR
jgi:hypothetical protein